MPEGKRGVVGIKGLRTPAAWWAWRAGSSGRVRRVLVDRGVGGVWVYEI